MQAIGDDQLLMPQSDQRADDHPVEMGQQQVPFPQATAPVVPDGGDDDPTDHRHRYNGSQAHGPGLYAVPSASEIRSIRLRRRIGAARAFGPPSYRWLANGPWPGWPARHAGADTPVGDTP